MRGPVAILGAGGGIGGAIARRLATDGWPLLLLGRDPARLDSLGLGTALACDAIAPDSVAAAFRAITARGDGLAGVVVGIAEPFANRLAHRTAWEVFAQQMETQLKALHLVAAAFPLLRDHPGTARLVVVGSEFALGTPPPKTAPYAAAKAAMTAYARVIAQEWLRHGIRVHILAPGLIRTSLVADMPDSFLDDLATRMPERMLTRAEDVADLVAFCLTDAADTLYGTPLRVSRGPR